MNGYKSQSVPITYYITDRGGKENSYMREMNGNDLKTAAPGRKLLTRL